MKLASFARHAVALALFALGGCTMVLGIHKAEHEDAVSTTGGTSTGTGSSSTQCKQVAPSCSSCLMLNCAADTKDCLADSDCRISLDTYASCLDGDCTDKKSCAENVIAKVSLARCMSTQCSAECEVGAVLSRCELYCACMGNACSDNFTNELGGSQSCVDKCKLWTLDRDVKCRWRHCEFASTSAADGLFHCPHAIGNLKVGNDKDVCVAVIESKRHICGTGGETGFPCHLNDDCCTKSCRSSICD